MKIIIVSIIITVIVVITIAILYPSKTEKRKVKKKKDHTKYEGCKLLHYPLRNKWAVQVDGLYPFECVGGYFSLHHSPSYHHMYNTKEEAKKYLDLFLEWRNKDIEIHDVT